MGRRRQTRRPIRQSVFVCLTRSACAATVAVGVIPAACQRQPLAVFLEARSVLHGSRFMVQWLLVQGIKGARCVSVDYAARAQPRKTLRQRSGVRLWLRQRLPAPPAGFAPINARRRFRNPQ